MRRKAGRPRKEFGEPKKRKVYRKRSNAGCMKSAEGLVKPLKDYYFEVNDKMYNIRANKITIHNFSVYAYVQQYGKEDELVAYVTQNTIVLCPFKEPLVISIAPIKTESESEQPCGACPNTV